MDLLFPANATLVDISQDKYYVILLEKLWSKVCEKEKPECYPNHIKEPNK